ncbi:MAG: RnfABCDGE type electron transport complex subunit D [Woeseiaceae bacterium]|nr:RnfABCDGE type electron transport complex subunit D [Woeseiaceae bacterium]
MNSDVPQRILKAAADPRYYQIAVLGSLLIFGIGVLGFDVTWLHAVAIFATALAVQYLCTRLVAAGRFDPLSPLITSLSLTLLLRTDVLAVAAGAAAIAIASKFLVRFRSKHVFNPANAAIVVAILLSDRAWVSTGQWGSAAIGAFAFACLGFLVLTRAKRSETTIAFLAGYALLVFGRALWLGDPLSIPVHQLQNGALLLFAFFMISDPKTAPDAAIGRVLYGLLVAVVTYVVQFVFFEPGAPILALVMCAPLVPVIDACFVGRRYVWRLSLPRGAATPADVLYSMPQRRIP